MQKVIIHKDKITLAIFDEAKETWHETEISKDGERLGKYFNKLVEVKEDVKVEDFMNLLHRHEQEIDYCFSAFMDELPFSLFYADMNSGVGEGNSDLEAVEMFWSIEIINNELIMLGTLRGWLSEDRAKELDVSMDIPHDISFLSLSLWKNAFFEVNEFYTLRDLGHIDNLEEKILHEGINRWTLFELIRDFLCEITVNGSPEQREKLLEEMEKKSYDINELAKDKEQALFWLDVLQGETDDCKNQIQRALDEEEYEMVSSLKNKLKILEQEIADINGELSKNGTN